jgi:hypothetical protein
MRAQGPMRLHAVARESRRRELPDGRALGYDLRYIFPDCSHTGARA